MLRQTSHQLLPALRSSNLLSHHLVHPCLDARPPLARRKLATATANDIATSPKTTDSSSVDGVLGGEGKHPQDKTPKFEEDLDSGTLDLSKPFNGAWTLTQPVYTEEQLQAVRIVARKPTTASDKVSLFLVKALRKGFDFASFYKHKPLPQGHESMTLQELRNKSCFMTPDQWLTRIVFLETTAAIPGMVGGAIRHLQSLRLLRRDGGWIHTLLSEAENERMHLLTFMQLKNPKPWFRALVLVSQGVFYNLFFLTYLLSPRMAHRFVACLEEEAVRTYTRCIADIEDGRLPEWSEADAPAIAKSYWQLKPDAKLLDVIKAVRADEATHRFVNHTLANLDSTKDFSPFSICEPSAEVRGSVPGFERDEAALFASQARAGLSKPPRDGQHPKAA